jgi:TetR/AcrR family transcriptional regulator, transcriptional repressor for nem operon
MRITKEQAAENRSALLQAAGRLFRKHGIDGVGVAEISKEAGLTHGALYAHFASKEALAAEALSEGLKAGYAAMLNNIGGAEPTLADLLDFYLSARQRDNVAMGCAMSASLSEIGRQDQQISERFAEGFELMVETAENILGELGSKDDRRQRALTIVGAMIGSLALARATAKSRPMLSDEILIAVRRVLGELGAGTARPVAPARPAKPAKLTARRKTARR